MTDTPFTIEALKSALAVDFDPTNREELINAVEIVDDTLHLIVTSQPDYVADEEWYVSPTQAKTLIESVGASWETYGALRLMDACYESSENALINETDLQVYAYDISTPLEYFGLESGDEFLELAELRNPENIKTLEEALQRHVSKAIKTFRGSDNPKASAIVEGLETALASFHTQLQTRIHQTTETERPTDQSRA